MLPIDGARPGFRRVAGRVHPGSLSRKNRPNRRIRNLSVLWAYSGPHRQHAPVAVRRHRHQLWDSVPGVGINRLEGLENCQRTEAAVRGIQRRVGSQGQREDRSTRRSQ